MLFEEHDCLFHGIDFSECPGVYLLDVSEMSHHSHQLLLVLLSLGCLWKHIWLDSIANLSVEGNNIFNLFGGVVQQETCVCVDP